MNKFLINLAVAFIINKQKRKKFRKEMLSKNRLPFLDAH
jgi:hypothetical protein